MRHEQLLSADRTAVILVDIQEVFAGHIPGWESLIQRAQIMVRAARLLDLPLIVTEQYPKGLGHTDPRLKQLLGDRKYHEKTVFSALQADAIKSSLLSLRRSQIVILGVECHVCVTQTALDALALGLQPQVMRDAVGSRHEIDQTTALDRMRQAGVVVSTVEAAVMELIGGSGHPDFRDISRLIK